MLTKDIVVAHAFGHHADDGRHGIRRPRMQGSPPIWRGSTVIRVNRIGFTPSVEAVTCGATSGAGAIRAP